MLEIDKLTTLKQGLADDLLTGQVRGPVLYLDVELAIRHGGRRSGYFGLYVIVRSDSWRLMTRPTRAQLPRMPGLRGRSCDLFPVSGAM
jgi:hypothetical protein